MKIDRTLLRLLAVGFALHFLIHQGNLESPFGRTPTNDAAYYWNWAGKIAEGEWISDSPFFSAPLYPYLLAVLRLAGFGLTAVFLLQLLMHLATGALLFRIADRLWERRVGLVACGLWLLLTGPAASHGRILAGTLQCLCVTWVLERALALHASPDLRRSIGLGIAAGVTSLAWPALLPAGLVLAVWAFWVGARASGAGAMLGAMGLCIAPATVHNYVAADVFVPISAHAGITFWHGNNPSANGVFAAHEVASVKEDHDEDALAQTREALGEDAGWGEVSGYFMDKGIDWWKSDPGGAVKLAFKKAWLFTTARAYGDMYMPTAERNAGLWTSLWFAPVPVAWWIWPALVAGALLLRRDPKRFAPLVLLILVPWAICTVFWYSPRYRLPAVPAATLLSAWVVVELFSRRGKPYALAVVLALAAATGLINRRTDVDPGYALASEVEWRAGHMVLDEGDVDGAIAIWERILEGQPEHAQARTSLLQVLRQKGRDQGVVELLELRLKSDPFHQATRYELAMLLATSSDDEARNGRRALELATAMNNEFGGTDPQSLDALAAATAETGNSVAAVEIALRAARIFRSSGEEAQAREVEQRLLSYREGRPYRSQ